MGESVTAVVVNWNGSKYLSECLGSLLQQSYGPLDVVVVDNASVDGSEHIAQQMGVAWIPLHQNVGLAAAFNAGAAHAEGDLLLFLNNDMRFASDFVERMVTCLERNPKCEAVDAVQLHWRDESPVHEVTALVRGSWKERLPGWRFAQQRAGTGVPTAWPSGANTLVRAKTLAAIGGWDARFFAGYEDVDLGWRIWLSGGEVRLAADALCWHDVGGSSSGEGAPIRETAAVHGPLLFALKHAPVEVALAALLKEVPALVISDRRGSHQRAVRKVASELVPALRWRRTQYHAWGTTPRKHWRAMQRVARAA